jgi:hypothetical protein
LFLSFLFFLVFFFLLCSLHLFFAFFCSAFNQNPEFIVIYSRLICSIIHS